MAILPPEPPFASSHIFFSHFPSTYTLLFLNHLRLPTVVSFFFAYSSSKLLLLCGPLRLSRSVGDCFTLHHPRIPSPVAFSTDYFACHSAIFHSGRPVFLFVPLPLFDEAGSLESTIYTPTSALPSHGSHFAVWQKTLPSLHISDWVLHLIQVSPTSQNLNKIFHHKPSTTVSLSHARYTSKLVTSLVCLGLSLVTIYILPFITTPLRMLTTEPSP